MPSKSNQLRSREAICEERFFGLYRVLSDESGHDYFIPLGDEEEFYAWVEATENGAAWDGQDFDSYRLRLSLSSYIITNPERGRSC